MHLLKRYIKLKLLWGFLKNGKIAKEQSKDAREEYAARTNNDFKSFTAEEVDGKWLDNCVVGKVRWMDCIVGLEDAFINAGVVDITVRHMGGMMVLLEFASADIKGNYMDDGAP